MSGFQIIKLVIGLKEFTYEERLTQLNKLYRFEERRLRGDLIETIKLLTEKENIDPHQFFNINLNNLRGHSEKLNQHEAMETQIFQSKGDGCMEFLVQRHYICTLY